MHGSYAQAIYTPAGIASENVFTHGEKVLHIGSGSRILPGAASVDVLALPGVDTVYDLNMIPWPYPDQSFDVVYAHSVLEHLHSTVAVMEEIWRILRPGGRVVISVPYFRSTDAFVDPTHIHFFTSHSMDNFLLREKGRSNYSYTNRAFKEVGFWYGWPHESKNPLARLLKRWMRHHKEVYDQYVSVLFPVKMVIWELEVIK